MRGDIIMKKVLSIVLSVALMLSLSAVAMADVFVSSPSANPTPTIVSADPSNPSWNGTVVITGYGERENLPPEKQDAIEDAYKQIKGASDVTSLNSDLKDIAEGKNVKPQNLLVSDLFDLSYTGTNGDHGTISVKLDLPSDQRFVALMQFNNGEWTIVDNASFANGVLSFDTTDLTQYAVVVDGTKGSPKTAQNDVAMLYVVIALAAAGAVVLMVKSGKKCGQK